MLLNPGATITLIKGPLQGEAQMHEECMTLTDVTGHKIYMLGKIKAMVNLEERRYNIQCCEDNFSIDYKGIIEQNVK